MPWTHYRPTQDQIREGCETIRESWDEATHRQRWVRPIRENWTPPKLHAALLLDDDWERHAWTGIVYSSDA
jgi:hypothetical protein